MPAQRRRDPGQTRANKTRQGHGAAARSGGSGGGGGGTPRSTLWQSWPGATVSLAWRLCCVVPIERSSAGACEAGSTVGGCVKVLSWRWREA